MTMDRWGGGALILGTVAFIALMAVHPSHGGGPALFGSLTLSALVHGTALATIPILLFGFYCLTLRLGGPLPLLALSFYLFSAVFVVLAATMSGFIIAAIMQAAHSGGDAHMPPMDPSVLQVQLQSLANYTVWLNRAFAAIHVGLFSVAILLWSLAWSGGAIVSWIMRILGIVLGGGVLAWEISGTMTLEAQHGALVVTLAHAIWTLAAAVVLLLPRKA